MGKIRIFKAACVARVQRSDISRFRESAMFLDASKKQRGGVIGILPETWIESVSLIISFQFKATKLLGSQ